MSETSVRRFIIVAIVMVLLAVLGFLGWRLPSDLSAENEKRRGGDTAAIPVETASIQRGRLEQQLQLAGTLTPSAAFTLRAQVSARLNALLVDIGDEVKRGQVIAQLDAQIFEQRVKEAEAAVKVAEAALKQAQSQLGIKKRASDRANQLLASGISAESEHDQAVADYESAVAAIAVAEAELQQKQAALASARINLQDTKITADWEGDDAVRIVSERFVDEGASIQNGQSICSFIKIEPLYAELQVTESQYGLIHDDQQAVLTADTWANENFPAKVERIAPSFNPLSRQALVRLVVQNDDRRLKPGMFVRASITVKTVEDALIVPDTAIISRQGDSGVFMLNADQSVSLVPVRIGIRNNKRVQIIGEGLQGEVVTLGQHLLKDGIAVKVHKSE